MSLSTATFIDLITACADATDWRHRGVAHALLARELRLRLDDSVMDYSKGHFAYADDKPSFDLDLPLEPATVGAPALTTTVDIGGGIQAANIYFIPRHDLTADARGQIPYGSAVQRVDPPGRPAGAAAAYAAALPQVVAHSDALKLLVIDSLGEIDYGNARAVWQDKYDTRYGVPD